MAMKFQDHQEKLYQRYVNSGSNETISPYQHILNKITTLIIENQSDLFRNRQRPETNDNQENVTWLSDRINEYVQLKEYEILISCDLNLNIPTGSDIFESILRMSNPNYDFNDTIKVVDRLS